VKLAHAPVLNAITGAPSGHRGSWVSLIMTPLGRLPASMQPPPFDPL